MSAQALEPAGFHIAADRPLDAWPDDLDCVLPPDPARDDRARAWAECNSDLARHLASIPEPPDSPEPPPVTALEFAEDALADGPDAAATILASVDPGPGSAVLVGMLDPARLAPDSMVEVIAATEKLASWVQALQHRWLAAFTSPGVAASREGLLAYASAPGQPLHRSPQPSTDSPSSAGAGVGSPDSGRAGVVGGGDTDLTSSGPTVHGDTDLDRVIDEAAFKVAAAEVSAALHFSPVTAQRRVRQALDFTIDLPGTLQALSQGRIDRGRALTILDRTENLSSDLRRRVETAVLPKATTRTPGQLRGIVDRAVISVDPAAAKKRQIKAREERHVTVRPNRDGMSTFIAEIAAENAAVAFSVLDRVATTLHRRADESRRIGALRADVFSDIFDQLATQGAVDMRATIGGRAVVTHDPLRYSWISDSATIAGRFDPDTSLIDSQPDSPGSPESSPDPGVGSSPTPSRPNDPDIPEAHAHVAAVRVNTEAADDATPGTEPLGNRNASPKAGGRDDDLRCGPPTTGPDDVADESDSAHPESATVEGMHCGTGALAANQSTDKPDSADFALVIADYRHGNTAPPGPGGTARGADVAHIPSAITDDVSRASGATDPESAARGMDVTHIPSATADDLSRGPGAPDPGSPPCEGPPIRSPFLFPTQQGRLTHLNVTIAATTLAGLDDLPGELDGYGPIPADLCRALAVSAASITAVAVDPTCGRALDIGRTTYRPRLSHRDHVTQRDRTCRFPGCRQPARRCQIDHSEEFCDGGPTCPCNLACLCKFHHDLKTTGLWDALQHPDASITWTSPTGRKYRSQTPELPLATRESPAGEINSTNAETEGCDRGTTSPAALGYAATAHAATGHAATGHAATGHAATGQAAAGQAAAGHAAAGHAATGQAAAGHAATDVPPF